MNIQLAKGAYATYAAKGISYAAYMQQFEALVTRINNNEVVDYPHAEYLPINLQRMQRINKTFTLHADIKEALQYLTHETTWLVLTEFWCGDAAQNIPVFHKIAEASNGRIKLLLLFRDSNLPLMDAYLTDGSRSVPKLIQMDTHYHVSGYWGPRPTPVQHMVKEYIKDKTNPPHGYIEDVQKWYAKDKSETIQHEVLKLLKLASALCPDCMI